jgi:hypothetical protein
LQLGRPLLHGRGFDVAEGDAAELLADDLDVVLGLPDGGLPPLRVTAQPLLRPVIEREHRILGGHVGVVDDGCGLTLHPVLGVGLDAKRLLYFCAVWVYEPCAPTQSVVVRCAVDEGSKLAVSGSIRRSGPFRLTLLANSFNTFCFLQVRAISFNTFSQVGRNNNDED